MGSNQLPCVLVTGGAQRLGRAIALRFANEGYDIAIHYRSSGAAAFSLCDDIAAIGVRAEAFQADLANSEETDALVPAVFGRFPNLIGLVNSASVFERCS